MSLVPIAPDLFEDGADGPTLFGGRCKDNGRIVFPLPCGASAELYDPVRLGREGRLWTWTVQRFRPKSPPYAGDDTPETFRPFAVGYIELRGEVIVESRLEVDDFGTLSVGLPMELVCVRFPRSDASVACSTYAFRPATR